MIKPMDSEQQGTLTLEDVFVGVAHMMRSCRLKTSHHVSYVHLLRDRFGAGVRGGWELSRYRSFVRYESITLKVSYN